MARRATTLERRFADPDAHVERSLRGVLEQSYLITLLRSGRSRALSSFRGRTIDFPDGSRLQLAPAVYAKNEPLARPDHPNFRLVLETVEQARALAEQGGSQFLVLLVPTKEEVYLPLLDEPPPTAIAPFLAAFDEAGIPYLDLTPNFQASAREGERLFFEVDGHPNAAGYRRIAEVVLEHLRRQSYRTGGSPLPCVWSRAGASTTLGCFGYACIVGRVRAILATCCRGAAPAGFSAPDARTKAAPFPTPSRDHTDV